MPPPDVIEVLLRPIAATGIPHMVTGGLAVAIYGEPFVTNDADIVIDLAPEDVGRLAAAFAGPDYHVPPLEVIRDEAARDVGGHFNILHRPLALRADVYVAGKARLARWGLERRRAVPVSGGEVFVAPLEYVVVMKLDYFRQSGLDRHLRDVATMLRLSRDAVDRPALEHWLGVFGLEREFDLAQDKALSA